MVNNKMKTSVICILCCINMGVYSQNDLNSGSVYKDSAIQLDTVIYLDSISYSDTSIRRLQVYSGFTIPRNFDAKYRRALRQVRRVYPIALETDRVIDSMENALKNAKNNRERRRIKKQVKKQLQDQFEYNIKDLYRSEGRVLMKLINRETGKTVKQILNKYSGGLTSFFYSGIASVFDQDLESVYHPNKEDFVVECVIQDIKAGRVAFNPDFHRMTKEMYKKRMKEYRERKRNH